MNYQTVIASAYDLLDRAVLTYKEKPVGTAASLDPHLVAPNYQECFVRDFMPSAFVFLLDGKVDIVRNFLQTVVDLSSQQAVMEGHDRTKGLMPASFRVPGSEEKDTALFADFGDRAIGRVAPVDSAMWWILLLRAYGLASGDTKLAHTEKFQEHIRLSLKLYLQESFETSPAMLVPDGSFMIDRRMGVYGHPLEIQALFYGFLNSAQELLIPGEENNKLLKVIKKRLQALRSYVRICYWLDQHRLNEIYRFESEEFGEHATNVLNIYPETIPEWLDGWLDAKSGYFVGNLGAGRMDFRFFSLGNLLAILFDLASKEQSHQIMNMFEAHWEEIVGLMPIKISYPAVKGKEWAFITGNDPKNIPWSYHNGGHWPCLLWTFVAAAIHIDRHSLAEKAIKLAAEQLHKDDWPEYYDGKRGSLIGRRAHLQQTWSAASVILSLKTLEDPTLLSLITF